MIDRGQKVHPVLASGEVWTGEVTTTPEPYAVRYVVDSGDSTIYYAGKAVTGSPTSTSVWRIKRITQTNPVSNIVIEWADGNSNFDNEWDERENLNYS